MVIFSLKNVVSQYSVGYPPLYTFVECNRAFVLYYFESKTNINICHGIDAILNSFGIRIKNTVSSNGTRQSWRLLKTPV